MQRADDLQRNIVLSGFAIQLSKSDNKTDKNHGRADIGTLNITLKIGISNTKII